MSNEKEIPNNIVGAWAVIFGDYEKIAVSNSEKSELAIYRTSEEAEAVLEKLGNKVIYIEIHKFKTRPTPTP